jgi:hypothetical protein
MKIKFSFLVALAATLVAGCAAYYSVFGLSQLFAGAGTAVIIMASSLEFSKVVAVSFLHKYWNKISAGLKIYLTIGVVILICITSAGIYGFLSNAYQKTANKLELSEGQLSILTNKKDLFQKNIDDNQKIIDTKNKRLQQLSDLRSTQETRIDAATNNSAKNKLRGDITSANNEIQKLNGEIDALTNKNTPLLDSVNLYSTKSIESKTNNNAAGEIGPLKYLAQLTGNPIDEVVNWFILLLIFVFDPLAVCLVIATNKVLELEKKRLGPVEPEPSVEPKKKRSFNFFKEFVNGIKNTATNLSNKTEHFLKQKLEAHKKKVQDPIDNTVIEDNPIVNTPIDNTTTQEPEETPKPETNRGFSVNIPTSNNVIERIGSNKVVKDGNTDKVYFKRR